MSTTHQTATRDEWLKARLDLLHAEKEHTKRGDELARRRQDLPWVVVDKDYSFDTEDGPATLRDLFGGRSQLLIYHFMFGPDYTAGCPSCSSIADGFNGITVHLRNHDVAFWAVSRALLAKLTGYRKRMGWTFPWASAFATDFNHDMNVGFTEEEQRRGGIEYNYRREPAMEIADAPEPLAGETVSQWQEGEGQSTVQRIAASAGTDVATFVRERPGVSAFIIEDGQVYHTYSAFARGLDGLWGMYQWLDRAPKGRNENDFWWRRHDEYQSCHDRSGRDAGARRGRVGAAAARMGGMDMGTTARLGSFAGSMGMWVVMMSAMMLPGMAPSAMRNARTLDVGSALRFIGA